MKRVQKRVFSFSRRTHPWWTAATAKIKFEKENKLLMKFFLYLRFGAATVYVTLALATMLKLPHTLMCCLIALEFHEVAGFYAGKKTDRRV